MKVDQPMQIDKYLTFIDALNEIGIALSSERESDRLLAMILAGCMKLTNADAGTLYLVEKNQTLRFEIFGNNTLRIRPRRIEKGEFAVKPIHLYNEKNEPNFKNITSYVVIKGQTTRIDNAYETTNFDFSGTRSIDNKLGYHSVSFLTVPLYNHENKIIGALQLINAIDPETKNIIPFSDESTRLAESLASQAAIILTQKELIESQKKLFEAFIQLIAKAIDEKSVYTSNHCTRVPIITMMIAEALNDSISGHYEDFYLTKSELEELRIAAWLHDCGKVSTPEYVMDKSTKLFALTDRIEVINLRFEILRRDLENAILRRIIQSKSLSGEAIPNKEDQAQFEALTSAQEYINKTNYGGESLTNEDIQKIHDIAKRFEFTDSSGNIIPLLNPEETSNLSIQRGTLNEEEREIIQNHVRVTTEMLESLPYPSYLTRVAQIAGSHHERLDGRGYPRGLTESQLLVQARIVAIADIFEALTAGDRPYKNAKKLSETLNIMKKMKEDRHIDPDIFDVFVQQKIFLEYAKKYLHPEQIDISDFSV